MPENWVARCVYSPIRVPGSRHVSSRVPRSSHTEAAAAAQTSGTQRATRIAFRTGAHVGMATVGLGLFGAAALFCLTGLVAGIRFWNRAETYRSGAWAIALAACAPVLTVMMLAGMGAT